MMSDEEKRHIHKDWMDRTGIACMVLADSLVLLEMALQRNKVSSEVAEQAVEIFVEHILEAMIPTGR